MAKLGRSLWTISQYYDRAEVKWLNESTKKTFEELKDSGEDRYVYLDALLAIALEKVLPPGLYRQFDRLCVKLGKTDETITGRQMIWMIHDYFRTNGHMNVVYGYKHLLALVWMGGKKMDLFIDKFDLILEHMNDAHLGDEATRDILYEKMTNSTRLKSDL